MDWPLFLTFLAACGAAAATGAMFNPGAWYDGLHKPTWTPRNWVFPVVWTTLYMCIAYAAMRVAGVAGVAGEASNAQALAFWALQIAFNTLWTPVFFGLHRIRAAMVVMVGLWLAVAATTYSFFGVDFWAGALFLPYLLWVTIAGALNFSVMRLNPNAG
ncbi:TspO/MBR family protein [Cypionkella sp.]|uniref:tryptophan-rich sensory protein TspO n=1 Tax=Cypionkella sp. TaxID=2811411 RepID=UPI0027193706|nr:TspO/MBR family protein [Cypionkella sp.]MDO8984831.1 TspO/MBR family protein [Cypionkella sp.]MDP1578534.1 TspO/MBR family protein [Cypionkella sp.]MDP2049124.1 TspO/MBR family protein [Cypionkella sp.]